jgi:hypothetical protein
MTDFDVCTLGAATLNDVTKVITVEISREFGLDGEFEPIGSAPLMQALGVSSLPVGPSDDGHADGIIMSPCGSYNAAIVGASDTRCADVYGELLPGDTCLHSTGPDSANRSRVFCKDGVLALLVGNDATMVFDRPNKTVSVVAFGHAVEVSDANGIYLAESGGSSLRLSGGEAVLAASSLNLAGAVSIGNAAAQPIALAAPIASYFAALEALLGTIAAATQPSTAPAVAAFISSTAAAKAAMAAIFSKAT